MDWTNDAVLRFLELYQMHPCIWDPQNVSHRNKTKVNDAWCVIKKELGFPGTIKELKKKRESLMSAYRGYKTKINKYETSGVGSSDVYKPTWFAFELMDSFLASLYTCQPSLNSQETMTTTRRRQQNPPELVQVKNQMDKAFKILETASKRQLEDDDDECNIFGKLMAKKLPVICANAVNSGVCTGDMGAPLVSGGVLIGVASNHKGCGSQNYPDVFTRIDAYVDWIMQVAVPPSS
ncbi:unnamed protein product [Danaus chrysippus]|uniref:(African queen) hypothetical protein n=1 Tax=Danaus chrysippus TaxID=151541 RepID=A0A8J2QRU7_9NEOP|nr:unnamed protein product [Danaus chrysippus]